MKSFKFRIYPTSEQEILIHKTFGSTRFVFNYLLNLKQEQYKQTQTSISKFDCAKLLPKLKQEYDWLCEVDSISLQASNEDLDSAYQMFFKRRNKFPNFKKKKHKQSYRTKNVNNSIRTKTNYIKIPKLGYIYSKGVHNVKGVIKYVTISQTASGKYFISVLTNFTPKQLQKTNSEIGIDMGLIHLMTLSNGEVIENQKYIKKYEAKLLKEQRSLSRKYEVAKKQKRKLSDSKNYQKQRIRVAKIQEKIMNSRKDYLQKVSTNIIKSHDVICVEHLSVKNMQQNHYLAKSISDVSWSHLVSMLEYKSNWYGKHLIKINKFFPSSKLCSNCGHKKDKLLLSERVFHCERCNFELDRDYNAAINILNEGLKVKIA